jgi:hypothetical protein
LIFFLFSRVYNPGKLHHYGLDFKSINDSQLVFTYQSSVYAGRPKGEPDEHYIQGVQVGYIVICPPVPYRNMFFNVQFLGLAFLSLGLYKFLKSA